MSDEAGYVRKEIWRFLKHTDERLELRVVRDVLDCVDQEPDEMNLHVRNSRIDVSKNAIQIELVWAGILSAWLSYPTKIVAFRPGGSAFETDSLEAFLSRYCDILPLNRSECESLELDVDFFERFSLFDNDLGQ
jgi:hypothetical protein